MIRYINFPPRRFQSGHHNYKRMIYPQEDETVFGSSHYSVNFPYRVESLKTRSPSLPLHFDKNYLPKDLCEKEVLGLSQCLLLYNSKEDEPDQMCSLEASRFQSCRKKRDLRILSSIYRWETQHIKGLDKQNRALYLRGLGFKLTRLEGDYGRQPSTVSGLNRISQLQAEIKEIKWRLEYLNKIKTELD